MNFDDWLSSGQIGVWNAVGAALIVMASWFGWRAARKTSFRLLGRLGGISAHLRLIASRIAGYAVLLTGIGIALAVLGAPLQPVLAVALLVIAVLVLALRGIANNFAAGVVIQTRQPVHLGDLVETGDIRGYVRELNGRSVIVEAPDGRTIHVPNAMVLESPIINHTTRGILRGEVEVRTTGGPAKLDQMSELLAGLAAKTAGVQADPPPFVRFTACEPGRITALVRFWHPWTITSRKVTSDVIKSLSVGLHETGHAATVTAQRPDVPLTPPPEV